MKKRVLLEDKAFVVLNQVPLTGTIQFYVSRNPRKRYSGNIINDSGSAAITLQIESSHGYFSQSLTLNAGDHFDFQHFPLSGVTLTGSGATYTLTAWATKNPNAYVRRIPKLASGGIPWPGPHALLDASQDNDTAARTPVNGDLILAQLGLWDKLAVGTRTGFTQQVLTIDPAGVLPKWNYPQFQFNVSASLAAPAATLTATLTGGFGINLGNLILVITHAGFAVADKLALRFNADNGANYESTIGETGAFSAFVSATSMQLAVTAFTFPGFYYVRIQNSGARKYVLTHGFQEIGTPAVSNKNSIEEQSGLWVSASNITSITLLGVAGNNLSTGEAITVYGTP